VGGALLDEETVAMLGAQFVVATKRISAFESRTLVQTMRDGYRRMKAADGHVPTPMASWMVGLDPETVVIDAPGDPHPSLGVVFLHGWGGSWVLPCWQVAQAVRRANGVTLCPATRFEGDWWSVQGERKVRATITALRATGVRKVVLVGLSNGGIGASLIAPKLRGEIDGMVLISGASDEAGHGGVPTLVIHGTHDSMVPAGFVKRYVARTRAKYLPIEGSHFVLLEKADEITEALTAFLRAR
jgi:pimeloyl-ACP methyl ester carboxylesterase